MERSQFENTSKGIALFLFGLFGICLLILLLQSIFGQTNDNKWFELFKSGFLFIGGALTTILGYYFGNRGIQEAEQRVVEAKIKLLQLEKLSEQLESDAPTVDEVGLESPNE